MNLNLTTSSRNAIFKEVAAYLKAEKFTITSQDFDRPWGGFFVIDESQAAQFAKRFFPAVDFNSLKISDKLSPKFLVVAPGKRLSWQYHHRRAEIWTVLAGNVGVITSDTDEQGALRKLQPGDEIKLKQGERHRLVGLDGWAVLAEIWQHVDANHPSDEEDIVRVQDDFGR